MLRSAAEYELAHSIDSFNVSYKDTGLFGVTATTEARGQQDLFFYIMEALVGLSHDITEPQIARARTEAKLRYLAHNEKSANVSNHLAKNLFQYGRVMTPEEMFARIDAVNATTIKQICKDILDDQDLALAAVGPIHELPDYNWFRRHTYWQRY